MSNFDEKVVDRIKALEREVERLKVKERPSVPLHTLHVGANRVYTTVTLALAAASDGDTIIVDPGSYAGFTIYPLQFIHIEGSGQPEFEPVTGKLIGGTIFTGKINLFDSVGSSLNNLGVDVSATNYDAVDTGSLVTTEQHRLNQRFTHLSINANPSTDTGTNTAHCFRSQGGSHLDISDVRTYGGAHGIAIRASWVNIKNCYIEDGLFSAIIVKAIPATGDAEYVNISDVICNNTRAASAGGIIVQAWDDSKARFVNINNALVANSAAPSFWIYQQDDDSGTVGGIVEHINVSNSTSVGCTSARAPFWVVTANYITFSGCQVISPTAATAAFVNNGGTNVYCINDIRYPATLYKAGFTTSDLIMKKLNVGGGGELTIADGAIAVTSFFHTVDTESDAASDDLTTISGGSAGDLLILRSVTNARNVVLVHGANLYMKGAANRTLDNTYDSAIFLCRNSGQWMEI